MGSGTGAAARIEGLKDWWEERKKFHHVCLNCGNKWDGYKKRPNKCPRCSDTEWDKNIPRPKDPKGRGKHKHKDNYVPITAVGIDLDLKNGLQQKADLMFDGSLTDALRDILVKAGVPRLKSYPPQKGK